MTFCLNGMAVTYTLCTSGDWDNNAAQSSARFDNGLGSGCTINPFSITWATNDVLVIPDGFELILNSNKTIVPAVTVSVAGDIYFDNGKLTLTDASSSLVLQTTANLFCGTPGSTIVCPNNSQIEVGGTQYKGNDLDVIQNSPRPSTVDQSGDVLPIELAYFEAKSYSSSVKFNWATYTEINNDYFSIEKSTDGINYTLLSTVDGAGNSSKILEYSFTDYSPSFGRSYYRLKQTDFDGASETFSPALIDFTSLPNGKLTFTNPVHAGSSITIYSNSSSEEQLTLNIYNMLGAKVLSKEFTGSEYVFNIDSDVRPGVYFVKIFSSITEQTGRLIIQ